MVTRYRRRLDVSVQIVPGRRHRGSLGGNTGREGLW